MKRSAFTVIELVVAISIIAILIVLTIPVIGAMGSGTRQSSAINAASVGVEMARHYATQKISSIQPPISSRYRGAAAIFHPNREIRLVQHDQQLKDTSSPPAWLQPGACGYIDAKNSEYLRWPANVAILGVTRQGGEFIENLRILNPPFAVSFSENGHLLASSPASAVNHHVYYRWGLTGIVGDSLINTSDVRNNYDPTSGWTWNDAHSKHAVPFQRIESVVGVLIIENPPADLSETGGDGITNATVRADLLSRGRVIFFNRYTGTALR